MNSWHVSALAGRAYLLLQLTTDILRCYVVSSYIAIQELDIIIQFLVERRTARMVCGTSFRRAQEEHAFVRSFIR